MEPISSQVFLSKRKARVITLACVLAAIWALVPTAAKGQERLKIIYSQFTMTNSVTWFAREAGLLVDVRRHRYRRPLRLGFET